MERATLPPEAQTLHHQQNKNQSTQKINPRGLFFGILARAVTPRIHNLFSLVPKYKILLGSFIFLSLYTGALYTFATTYVSPGTTLDPLGIPGSYAVTPPLTYGGAVTSGHDGEVTYIDASGNLASDDLFTRDSGDTKQTDIFSNTYAQGIDDKSSFNPNGSFQADNVGTIGNAITLVFNGTTDTYDSVLNAWNATHPSNTATLINGTGTDIPNAQTLTLAGGGTAGYVGGAIDLGITNIQGAGLIANDVTNNGLAVSSVGNMTPLIGSNAFGTISGYVNTSTSALSLLINSTEYSQLVMTDQGTYYASVLLTDTDVRLSYNGVGFNASDSYVGWYDNGASTVFELPTSLPASTSYVLGVSALNANTATLDWVLPGGASLTGYTDNPNTALGIDTAGTGVGDYNTFLGNGAGYNLNSGDRNTFVGQDVLGTSNGGPYNVSSSTFVGQQINIGGDASQIILLGHGANTGTSVSNAIAIGINSSVVSNGIALGFGANASGNAGVAIGESSTASGIDSIAIGQSASATEDDSIAIGSGASTVGHPDSIAIGTNATNTASSQFVVGSNSNPISDFYFGNGVTNTGLPQGTTLHATGGAGVDKYGGLFTIQGGQSTGNIAGGNLLFKVSPSGASGGIPNTYHTFLEIGGDKISKFGDVDDAYYGLLLDIDNNAGGINLGNMGGAGGNSTHISINDGAQSIIFSYGADSYTFPIADGTADYVLATDGAGQLFWQDPTLIPSDQTLKSNIAPSTYGLSTLLQLNPVSYTLNANNKQQIGFIAQEVEPLIPELVGEIAGGKKGLAYGQLSAVIVKAIQELDLKIKPLEDLMTENNAVAEVLRAWFANASNNITRIFTGEICLTEAGYESECITRSELQNLKQLINNGGTGSTGGTSGTGGDASGDSSGSDGTTTGDISGTTTGDGTGGDVSGSTTGGETI